ncbi:MAG: ribonuclease HI [Phycisphaerales bacterium]|nr:ribonuclease HI [Phycisphaerales bacterium]
MGNPLFQFELHSDGACLGNPGPGGWACIVRNQDGGEQVLVGGATSTTNNRMELTAVLEGLRSLPEGAHAQLHADSQYVLNGLTEWLDNWKQRGWRTSGRKPVKNIDLWKALDQERARLHIECTWVEGHAGHPENERCDMLAKQQAEMYQEDLQA